MRRNRRINLPKRDLKYLLFLTKKYSPSSDQHLDTVVEEKLKILITFSRGNPLINGTLFHSYACCSSMEPLEVEPPTFQC
ncbi:hypothetical protein TNCV_4827641 [Trichonephila clavipes]|uniref:Uncharacterized protein n=1 Tax=Trichonephila clavipes TaxID=2585209 RepID=A0A8X6SN06_TRICX|nr:hypothetical protein TNCV_4827641 [Trichonephila clavipes]